MSQGSDTAKSSSGTILVIDDNQVQRRILEMVLSEAGFKVECSRNVDEALHLLEDHEPDLILSDMCMPGETGLDLLTHLRGNRRCPDVPVVMVSALDDERAIEQALREGASDFITKPYTIPLLRARVQKALDTARSLREARENAHHLNELAHHDELTGVCNRRRLMDVLGKEMERSEKHSFPLSLLMMDVDHFKTINDTYGHAAGDEILKQFAKIANDTMRTVDVLCRFGGEEFCAIMILTEVADAAAMAERIRATVERTSFAISADTKVKITVSIGAAGWRPEDGHDPARLIRHADAALYRAKTEGRNRVEQFGEEEKTQA